MAKVKNYYKILGVSRDANEDQIKMAFHNEAQKYQDGSTQDAQDLVEAYEVLANNKRRAQYDRYIDGQINTSQLQSAAPTSPLQPMSKALMNNDDTMVPTRANTESKALQCWEYLTLESSHNYGKTKYYVDGELITELRDVAFSDVINRFGGEGWEMVGIGSGETGSTYIFKRPTDEPRVISKKSASA